MAENTWLVVGPRKVHVTSADEWNDGLSKLPDGVLLMVMSSLTMKEAARTNILSHKWRELWPYFSGVFHFERSGPDKALFKKHASDFVSWVNRIVEQHRGPAIEGFKVVYGLDSSYQCHINKWVLFALAKGAKSLVLDLKARYQLPDGLYTLPLTCCDPLRSACNLAGSKPGLKTLVLKSINITTEVLKHFLMSCPFLEKLCISWCMCLTSVTDWGLALALKHLEVIDCDELENIDISAPKLVTFKYTGPHIQLHIRNASLLSEVSLGAGPNESIAFAFDSLSEYFSHLKLLHVTSSLDLGMNLVMPPVSNLTNLKHLILTIYAKSHQSLIGWVSLVEASPVLQKLTLQLTCVNLYDGGWSYGRRRYGRPLKSLKTLELSGFVGRRIDLELATYVVENAVMLQEVIIDLKLYGYFNFNRDKDFSRKRAARLGKKLRRGAKLVLNE